MWIPVAVFPNCAMNLRRLGYILAVIAILIAMGFGIAYLLLNDEVQETIERSVAAYLKDKVEHDMHDIDSTISVEIGALRYGFFTQHLEIDSITILDLDGDTVTGRMMHIVIPNVTCTGVAWWDVLFGDGLSLGTITIDSPVVTHVNRTLEIGKKTSAHDDDTTRFRLPSLPNVDSVVQVLMIRHLPLKVRPLHIEGVHISDATFYNRGRDSLSPYDGTFTGISLDVEDISMGTVGDRPIGHFMLEVDSIQRVYADGRFIRAQGMRFDIGERDTSFVVDTVSYDSPVGNRYYADGVRFSYPGRSIAIDSFRLRPGKNDADFFTERKVRADRFEIAGSHLRFVDIDIPALSRGEQLHVRKIAVGQLDLDILSNKVPPPTRQEKPPLMPYQLMRSVPFSMNVDTIQLKRASITYSEKHPNSSRYATLFWSGVRATISGISNDPARQRRQPVVIDASGQFMNRARMWLTCTMPMNVERHELDAVGGMHGMDATVLASFLTIAENIGLQSGRTGEARFKYSVRGRTSRGTVDVEYQDLKLQMVDKKTKKSGGLFNKVVSWLANWLVVKNDNVPGDRYKTGVIDYTLPRDAAIMQTVWFPLRDGLGDVIGF